jgi:hypothetical protein
MAATTPVFSRPRDPTSLFEIEGTESHGASAHGSPAAGE